MARAKAETDRSMEEAQIARLETKYASHTTTPLSTSAIKVQMEKAYNSRNSLREIHTRIVHAGPSDLPAANAKYASLDDRLDVIIEGYDSIQQQHAQATSGGTAGSTHHRGIKLPEIQLPTFDGKYEDWPSFEDLFTATIINNPILAASQRLSYLKSCTTGEANNLIKAFKITDANYAEAWDLLKARYKNIREIVASLIRKVIHHPRCKTGAASELQLLLNNTMESVRSLNVLGRPTDQWDDLLSVIMTEKLDPESRSEWAKTLTGTNPTTFKEICDFLENHIRALTARGNISTANKGNQQHTSQQHNNPRGARAHHVQAQHGVQPKHPHGSKSTCPLCAGTHFLYKCPKLHSTPQNERFSLIQKTAACINCLSPGHQQRDCSSTHTCKRCQQQHHTLLHRDSNNRAKSSGVFHTETRRPLEGESTHEQLYYSTTSMPNTEINQAQNLASNAHNRASSACPSQPGGFTRTHHTLSYDDESSLPLLKTAIGLIEDRFGKKHAFRAFLDEGSESSFITESCAAILNLPRQRTSVDITGVGSCNAGRAKWKVAVRVESSVYPVYVNVEALVLGKITENLPRKPTIPAWEHIHDLPLADSSFYKPGKIDLLLGVDALDEIDLPGYRVGPPRAPTAKHTIFGWVLYGRTAIQQQQSTRTFHVSTQLDEIVQSLWKEQKPPNNKTYTKDEMECEQHFRATVSRDPAGRYTVRLPFYSSPDKPNVSSIGETRRLAESRLVALERRFTKHPQHHAAYIQFMKEYEELGHMSEISAPANGGPLNPYYIPHHFVLKDDSTTTKLRVVFDASMKSSTGDSLNSTLMVGPTIQDDLFSILLRFRMHPVAIKGDIAKMYRQFQVHPDDRHYQRILWREDPTLPIKEYTLNTVTYGTASAPFLATRCLQQLGSDEQGVYPRACAVLRRDMYVDDMMSGEQDDHAAIELVQQLNVATAAGGMSMRKYCSNSQRVMDAIPPTLREETTCHSFDHDDYVKALGIIWLPKPDTFTFYTKCNATAATKRSLLSEIAKVFDPLGWLSPVTITAKILFQSSWKQQQNWDDPLDQIQQQEYAEYQQQLYKLASISIPRYVPHSSISLDLIGFSDASEKAYAACIYLCSRDQGGGRTSANLLAARTKVAPLKQVSLPRLELCAALLLSELVESVTQALDKDYTIHCYTDSMIVLKWISSTSRRWKTYVANRVAAIQEVIPPESWSHVCGTSNPADLPSRGIAVDELLHSTLWWNGPPWLLDRSSVKAPAYTSIDPETSEGYSTLPEFDMEVVLSEERSKPVLVHHASLETPFIIEYVEKFSSLNKLITTTAILQKFIRWLPRRLSTAPTKITPTDRATALRNVLTVTQKVYFSEEYKQLEKTESFKTSSALGSLSPFLDNHGVLRVGGRLQKSTLAHDSQHQAILNKRSHLTELIISHYHLSHLHASIQLTTAAIFRQYWIIGGKSHIRLALRKCIPCRKARATTMQQQMGQLPSARVTQHRPFLYSGVDFAGPFSIKLSSRRKTTPEKYYFAIFVCMATKAIHLEAVSSLSTDAFVATFRRFTSRRGLCIHLYCDCGTNFVGADRVLQKELDMLESQMQRKLSELGTTFHYNTPAAPNQGGLWEAGVKGVKAHIRRVAGNAILTLEQFQTLLCQIEACLNSRPLFAMSPDPADMEPLTPGHFLIGCPLTAVPDPSLESVRPGRLDHWQTVQQMTQNFWKRWHNEYLITLQQRVKWKKPQHNAGVGDLVLITEDNTAPTHWRTGRIVAVHPGQDNLVRKATIRVISNLNSNPIQYSEVSRPINKLAIILPCEETE